jgi:predicted TIM-barrel fold metal-dependent hydrolase
VIIDAQIHLWEADRPDRPWPAGAKPDIPEPLTAERFIAMMDEVNVDRALISPPAVCGFDPSYALECAAKYPDRLAVTSRWNLDDPAWRERLPTWLDQPGMVGIRLGIVGATRERWRDTGVLEQFWSGAERCDIPLMVFTPGSLSEVDAAAEAHPGLRLVIDHVNLMGTTPATVDDKVNELLPLARHPNLGVKLGALPIRSGQGYPFADLHAPLQRVYEAFGPRRLMWASDQTTTMAQDKASYGENLGLMRAAFAAIPSEDLDWILGRTVAEWFHWR